MSAYFYFQIVILMRLSSCPVASSCLALTDVAKEDEVLDDLFLDDEEEE